VTGPYLGANMVETTRALVTPAHVTFRLPVAGSLTALGIVYGDIGTSPLYALKQAAQASGVLSSETVLGIVSVIFWSLVVVVSLISWGGIEGYGTLRASALVESLQKVGTSDVPAIVKQLSGYRRWADPQLVRAVQSSDDREHLHASLALLPVDTSQVDCSA